MKKAIALMFCLTTITFSLPSGGDMTAEKVVESVSRTYSNLRSFRLMEYREIRAAKGSTPLGIAQGLAQPLGCSDMLPAWYETDLAESTPGRIRLEIGGVLVVSNGETMWAYLPVLNQYVQAAAVPLLGEIFTPSTKALDSTNCFIGVPYYGSDDIFRYRSLAHEAGRAKLRGEET